MSNTSSYHPDYPHPVSLVCVTKVGGCEKNNKPIITNATIRADGTIWRKNNTIPVLDANKATEADIAAYKAGNYGKINLGHLCQMGARLDGTEIITLKEYGVRREPVVRAELVKQAATRMKMLSVHLSTCGWGDFESVYWRGDADTPDDVIAEESLKLLSDPMRDIDLPNQSKQEILKKISDAKAERLKRLQHEDEAYNEACSILANTSEAIKKLAVECKFNPDNLFDDIDHPNYWEVSRYIHACEVDGQYRLARGMPAKD